MNRILKKFLQRGVDLSPVGVELREDNTNYFCTPKGASVFGWAGIDGIHFCFIRGFGEMVFSVSPMNTSPDYVHPVAENFTDFLRLILACGDVAAVEQAWMWNEAQFEAFLNENPTTQEQQQTLSEISEKMNLLPMEQPWTYIKNLQSSFDYSQIKYTEDYYDNDMTSEAELVAPEWKVYFDGDFWGHRGKDRAAVTSARFVIADAGIVPRRDVVKAHLQRAVQKCTEFEAAVAVDARIRRAARAVLADEVIHHLARKKLVLVEDVKRHTEAIGNTLRAVRLVAAERQRRARALVALLLQQKRGGGGIHAAAHGDQNFFLHLCPLIQILLQKCLARKRVGHLHERAVEAAAEVSSSG